MALAIVGGDSVRAEKTPGPKTVAAGLDLRIDRITWLVDQMNHGGGIPMPTSMTPGLPLHGYHRLSVEITVYNPGSTTRRFAMSEFALRSRDGHRHPPSMVTTESMSLAGKQMAHQFLHFDVPDTEADDLRFVWIRQGRERPLAEVPFIPKGHHSGPR